MVSLQTISFHGDVIDIIDNHVSVRTLCRNIGIAGVDDQYKKIQSDESYQSKFIEIEINNIVQSVFCIPYNKVDGWLFSISVNRVKPEVKQKLIEYKNECFEVLNQHFNKPQILPRNVINGYKSQLSQHNKKISNLKGQLEISRNKEMQVSVTPNEIKRLNDIIKKKDIHVKSLIDEKVELSMTLHQFHRMRKDIENLIGDFVTFPEIYKKMEKYLKDFDVIWSASYLFMEKSKSEYFEKENKKLKKQNTKYFVEMNEYKSQLQKVKNILGVEGETGVFMNDPVLHNNFLEFLYQANKATHEVNIIRHLSPKLDDTHQSLSNFMLHITRRYEKIRGVGQYKLKKIK